MIEITSYEEKNDAELAKEELANLPTMQELLKRAEAKGRKEAIEELVGFLTNDWGLDIMLSFTKREELKQFIYSNGEQVKEQPNE